MKKIIACLLLVAIAAAVTVVTNSFTNARLASSAQETTLTPANAGTLQKLGKFSTDADVFAQPLYIPSLVVSGHTYNVLAVATMGNSVYLFDADTPGSSPLKTVNFGSNQAANSYPGHFGDLLYQRQLGCLSTPVIDVAAGKMWVVCSSPTQWVIYRLELTTLSVLSSATISGSVAGTGDGGSTVTFAPLRQTSRAGLTLTGGNVYVSFGSMSDQGVWHGWIFGYDQTTLATSGVFCTTPDGTGGGVWQSGGGLSVDGSGNIYAVTGNGSGTVSSRNLNESVIKLDASLNVLDWYAPTNYATLNGNDWDMATGRPMLIPGTNLLVFGAKDFNVYSLNTACMGNIGGTNNGCSAPQKFPTGSGSPTDHQGVYACMYIPETHTGYFPNTAGSIYSFTLSGSTWNTTPAATSAAFQFPGAQMSGSSNGTSNQIVWASIAATSSLFSPAAGILSALDSSSLTTLWSSATNAARDAPGQVAKFNAPTIAAGQVFLGTLDNGVVVFGLPAVPPAAQGSIITGQAAVTGKAAIQ